MKRPPIKYRRSNSLLAAEWVASYSSVSRAPSGRVSTAWKSGGSLSAPLTRRRGVDSELAIFISSFPLDEEDRQNENDAEGGEAEQFRRLPPAAYIALVRVTGIRIGYAPD